MRTGQMYRPGRALSPMRKVAGRGYACYRFAGRDPPRRFRKGTTMTNIRMILSALVLSFLLLGSALASDVVFDASAFNAYGSDDGYVDLVRDGDTLVVTFDESRGSLPANMEGAALPLDDDLDAFRLGTRDALALYGGLAVQSGSGWLTIDVDGDATDVHEALLARLGELGIAVEEDAADGPIASYQLSHGDAAWYLAFTPNGDSAVIHLRAF